MKTALLITTDEKFRQVEFENSLEFFYKNIGCDMIEVTHPWALKKITGKCKNFVIIVDEEGLLKDNPKLNIYASAFRGMSLYGNAMIVKDTGEDFDGLTKEDHEELSSAIFEFLKKLEKQHYNL
jgi:hypothetical protein